jgi:hypothetical protein
MRAAVQLHGGRCTALFVICWSAAMRICGRAAPNLHGQHNDSAKFLDRKQGDA